MNFNGNSGSTRSKTKSVAIKRNRTSIGCGNSKMCASRGAVCTPDDCVRQLSW